MKVSCQEIVYAYRKQHPVLDRFSAEFEASLTLLLGFSGCGKSTLLKLIAGFLKPVRGRILLEGESPRKKQLCRQSIGFVFQQLNLLPLASIRQNLYMSARLAGLSPAQVQRNTDRYLEALGLEDYAAERPVELSGGQQQRAAIARALVKEPDLLLLDEPTSGLDELNTRIILQQLEHYAHRGGRIIIATHDTRLQTLQHESIDFNRFLPVERHLEAVAE